jgi:hypothetical protein
MTTPDPALDLVSESAPELSDASPPQKPRKRRRKRRPPAPPTPQNTSAETRETLETPSPAPQAHPTRQPRPEHQARPPQHQPRPPQHRTDQHSADPKSLAEVALNALRGLAFSIASSRGLTHSDTTALDHFTIPVTVAFDPSQRDPGEPDPVLQLTQDIEQQIAALQRASVAFCAGHVYCFLCNAPDCEHSSPPHAEDTFAGYSPSGRPAWVGFTNLCLSLQHERVDQLYSARPDVIAVTQHAHELTQNLLFSDPDPAVSTKALSYRVRGQVAVGLVPKSLDLSDTGSQRRAFTFHITEIRYGKAPLRLRVNLLGLSRADILSAALAADSKDAADRLHRLLRGTDRRLRVLAHRANILERRHKPTEEIDAQISGVLNGLRGEVERIFRPERRRTQHAQDRHRSGERPTSDAMQDLLSARPDHFLEDPSQHTLIILGPKRRAHVFTAAGQHVTSLRLDPGELNRKLEQNRWKPLDEVQARALRMLLNPPQAG